MDNQSPPDWAIIRAYRICHPNTIRTDAGILRNLRKGFHPDVFHVARYVAEKEEPSVDPDLVLARRIAGEIYRTKGWPTTGLEIEKGNSDNHLGCMCALEGIKQGKRIGVG